MKAIRRLFCRCAGHRWELIRVIQPLSPIHVATGEFYVCSRCQAYTPPRRPKIFAHYDGVWIRMPY